MVNIKAEDGLLPKHQAAQDLDLPWKDWPALNGNEEAANTKVLSIVGCGTLASAIFAGMLRKYDDETYMDQFDRQSGGSILPPYRFILNCSSTASCSRLTENFIATRTDESIGSIKVVQSQTVSVVAASDYIMLGCKPYMVAKILGQEGMREALAGKVLISICAGVTNEDLESAVYGDYDPTDTTRCRFIRVMPNTAAKINESMTIIAVPPKPLDTADLSVVEFMFGCIGRLATLPADKMDAATALAGSGPAFCLLMLEGLIDGGVAMGIPRKEATLMAAQTMKGVALNVMGGSYGAGESYEGTHPAVLRDQVTTPGGCTMGGLMVLEEEGVRGAIAKCIRRTTVVASQLGGGAKNVNGV